MQKKFIYYWNLFWLFRRLKFQAFLEFRGEFIFWLVVSTLWTIFNFFFFDIIINVSGNIGSWTRPQMFLLMSVFSMIDAFTWSWFWPNMNKYTNSIFSGEISQVLLKPADAQFLLMCQENSYTNTFRFLIGAAAFFWSLRQLEIQPNIVQYLFFLVLFTAALATIYFAWFIIATLAFWVDRLENINEIIPAARRLWQLPREVYTGLSSIIFTILLPFGLISSLPSEILLGKAKPIWVIYFLTIPFFLAIFSRYFFHLSIKKNPGVGN